MTSLITDEGFEFYGNRAMGITENPIDTTDGTFGYSNGTATPLATDTRAIFEADGTGGSKTILSATYNTGSKKEVYECYLTTGEGNTPGSITKIALYNDATTGKIVAEHSVTAITKNTDIELYFTIEVAKSNV